MPCGILSSLPASLIDHLPTDPPEAIKNDPEVLYGLLRDIRDEVITGLQEQGRRITKLEDAESKREETLGRIESKLDGLHTKDAEHAEHDERLDKLHGQVKEAVSDARVMLRSHS
ncbi:MAG: hypothetical protein R3B89_20350 [Polyangiaceae bacterium]